MREKFFVCASLDNFVGQILKTYMEAFWKLLFPEDGVHNTSQPFAHFSLLLVCGILATGLIHILKDWFILALFV